MATSIITRTVSGGADKRNNAFDSSSFYGLKNPSAVINNSANANTSAVTPATNAAASMVNNAISTSAMPSAQLSSPASTGYSQSLYDQFTNYLNGKANSQDAANMKYGSPYIGNLTSTLTDTDQNNPGDSGNGNGGGSYSSQSNALLDAYNQRANLLQQNYQQALGQLANNFNFNTDAVNRAADNALREAYINRMMNQKNLSQQMNMNGLTGGAMESTIAGLLNNYGNQRNNIETERINNIADLLNTYQNNIASAAQNYNSGLIDVMPTYSQLLSSSKTPSTSSSSTGTTSASSDTNQTLSDAVAYAKSLSSQEKSNQQIGAELLAQGYDYTTATEIMRSAGLL